MRIGKGLNCFVTNYLLHSRAVFESFRNFEAFSETVTNLLKNFIISWDSNLATCVFWRALSKERFNWLRVFDWRKHNWHIGNWYIDWSAIISTFLNCHLPQLLKWLILFEKSRSLADQFVLVKVEFRLQFLERPIQYKHFLFAKVLVDFGVGLFNCSFVMRELVKITLFNLLQLILFNHWLWLKFS